jgi:hypothetical protein
MPRFPKRLLALGGLAAAGTALLRRRRAARPSSPTPSPAPSSPAPPVARAAPATPAPRPVKPAAPKRSRIDALVEAEAAKAAAEAARIGGPRLHDAPDGDPALEPVYEAGGGDAEGFEIAEAELIENASHGDGGAEPQSDAFTPEREADEVTALDGEADEEKVSEVVEDATEDPEERRRDPGSGPGITHER